jgi:hypothetical protein
VIFATTMTRRGRLRRAFSSFAGPLVAGVRARSLGCSLFVPLVAACASQPPLLLGQPIKKEVAVLLRVSKDTGGDRFGGIAALAETVTGGLSEQGVANRLYASDDDHPGTPRIEIWVTRWGSGDESLRDAGGAIGVVMPLTGAVMRLAGGGEIELVVKVFREGDEAPACVRKYVRSTDPDDAAGVVSTGEILGGRVLGDALRPTADCGDDDASGNQGGSNGPPP